MNTIDNTLWKILGPVDLNKFDFNWQPTSDTPYIYVWGNKWHDCSTDPMIEYHQPGGTSRVYMKDTVALLAEKDRWKIMIPGATMDFTWRPNPFDPPYIYTWGNKWNDAATEPTIEYHVEGATERKYMNQIVELVSDIERWKIMIPGATMDFTWRPNPYDPPFIHVFGNKWNDAATEPTIEYHVEGATERKYITNLIAELPQCYDNWSLSRSEMSFDYSWRPNPYSPSQIYQWENNGPIYTVPGATDIVLMSYESLPVDKYYITTTLENLIAAHPHEVFWALNPELNYDKFDFSWKPTQENFLHINAFGNEESIDTNTYYVNAPAYNLDHREINYINDVSFNINTELDMFYINRGDDSRFDALKQRFPNLQKTRYLTSWVDTILRCLKKATTKHVWILSSDCDYTDFKFDFYPSSWQSDMIHIFGTQWSHWGNTYMVNRQSFQKTANDIKVVEHLDNINHVRSKRVKLQDCAYDILYIDHGNPSSALHQLCTLDVQHNVIELKYNGTYLDTLLSWVNTLNEYEIRNEHYVWVCSSLCDYSNFDFSYACDPFEREQLHVFASEFGYNTQKFGDTFLLNLTEFYHERHHIQNLDDYTKNVSYISSITVPRWQHPVIYHDHDSQATAICENKIMIWPYYELINRSAAPVNNQALVPNMWDSYKSPIIVPTTGASRILVPTTSTEFIYNEVYDYHNIEFLENKDESPPLDIIFFSNGEPAADSNYAHLQQILIDKKLTNRLVRVDGVVGRVASQHAAARASNTEWYFLINCKLSVNPDFNFSWQPDRLQQSKHYIFIATNPVNHLEYGHQAIVANNKTLTLNTEVDGLDFTLSSLHQVVNKNCGVAIYNTDAWTTWRTAFREVIKLKYASEITNNRETNHRLKIWLTVGDEEYGEYSILGARDAIEYYNSVDGNLDELMNSYDWEWIKSQYHK